MTKYGVCLNGENFWIDVGGDTVPRGFYVWVYVEAEDPDGAEKLAVEILRKDEDLSRLTQNPRHESPMIHLEEIQELESFNQEEMPRSGFAWYAS